MKLINNLSKYLFLLVALFSSCSLYAAVADVKVVTLTKVSETRIDRTKYDYVFKVTLKNGSDPLSNVVESLTAVGQGTTIIDGRVVVGDLAENAQTTPSDTITLRHDRTYAFNQAALVWSLSSEFPVIASEVTPEKIVTLSTGEKVVKGQIVVMTDEAVSRASLSLQIAKFKGAIVGQIPEVSTYQIELPSNSLESDWLYAKRVLQTSNGILSVSFNTMSESASVAPYYPNDTAWSSRPYGSNLDDTTWNMKLIHAPEAWGIAYGDTTTKVKVGIIDGGFKQGYNSNDELIFEKIYGASGADDITSEDPKRNNHGMHVSGIIGALGNNSKGVAGVAWKNTSLYAARTDFTFFNALTQITRLLKDGVKVINYSIGTPAVDKETKKRYEQKVLDDSFYANQRSFAIFIHQTLKKYDFLFVHSAGNDAECTYLIKQCELDAKYNGYASSVLSNYVPEAYPNSLSELKSLVDLDNVRAHLVSVASASVSFGESGDITKVVMPSYSQSGISVEIAAPGGESCKNILLFDYDREFSVSGAQEFEPSCPERRVYSTAYYDTGFKPLKGTSMAAPHVTGAAALVWQVNPNLNAAQVKNILISTAGRNDGGNDGFNVVSPSKDDKNSQGYINSYPVLNLEKAVIKAKETVGIKFQPEAVTTITGQVVCGSNNEERSDIVVQLNNDNAIPVSGIKTDASGVFAFSAKPGKYYLLFWNTNSNETVNTQLFTVGSNPITFKPIKISSTCGPLVTKEITADLASASNDSNSANVEFVNIPAGSFQMGDNDYIDQKPKHFVSLPAFAMSKFAVTFEQYDSFAEATGRVKPEDNGWGRGNRPVIHVTWDDATAYAAWLSTKLGKTIRLPSESEWEYAARAGTTTNYYWGSSVEGNHAACNGCGSVWDNIKSAPVGSFDPNQFGLFDMLGNVAQWTNDCYHSNYLGAPTNASSWLDGTCDSRVVRGSTWNTYPSSVASARRFGVAQTVQDGGIGIRLVLELPTASSVTNVDFVNIPAGTFTMGLTKQKYYKSPAHTVFVPAFSMSKYSITFDQYDEFANATSRALPSDNGWGRGNRPVINVSWYDAVTYTEWLSNKTGKKIRLPSNSEWEYAARAGTTTEYYWGDLVGVNNANCNGCGGVWNGSSGTSPVGTFAANPWGLFDVSGNVWQWTQDCDHPDYLGAPTDGSTWTSGDCGNRVYRGGSWNYPSENMHLAYSNSYPPSIKTVFIGFRVVMEAR